jgi:hypothetical protein
VQCSRYMPTYIILSLSLSLFVNYILFIIFNGRGRREVTGALHDATKKRNRRPGPHGQQFQLESQPKPRSRCDLRVKNKRLNSVLKKASRLLKASCYRIAVARGGEAIGWQPTGVVSRSPAPVVVGCNKLQARVVALPSPFRMHGTQLFRPIKCARTPTRPIVRRWHLPFRSVAPVPLASITCWTGC